MSTAATETPEEQTCACWLCLPVWHEATRRAGVTSGQGCVLISVGCRTCARGLAGVVITTEVPDWAALCASTQTACNVSGVIDDICELL